MITALVLLLSGCNITPVSAYDKEILKSSILDYENKTELKEEWDTVQGGTDSSDVFSLPDGGGVSIATSSVGWAYLSQRVLLKTNSYYKVTYEFSASSMIDYDTDKNRIGFFVGFLEDPNFNIGDDKSTEVADSTAKREITFYFHTKNIREANIALRVGTEDRPVSTSVTVNSISLTRVKKADALEAQEPTFELVNNVFGAATPLNAPYLIIGGIAIIVIAYAAFVLLRRAMATFDIAGIKGKFSKLLEKDYFIPIIVIGLALLLRLAIAGIMSIVANGKETLFLGLEAEKILEQAHHLAFYGPKSLFRYVDTPEFMPVGFYLSTVVGLIMRLFGSESGALGIFLIKLIAIAADLGVIYLIYKMALSKFSKLSSGLIAFGYSLLPAIFALSGIYAGWHSVAVFLLFLTFYFMLNKNLLGLGIAYLLSLLTTPYAIILAPIVVMYLIYIIIGDNKKLLPIAIGVVASVVVFYLAGLPFVIEQVAKGKAFDMFTQYIETLKMNKFYSLNALNFQALLNNNFEEITTESTFITILFKLLFLALLGVVAFKNKNRLDFVLGAGMYLALMVVFTNRMNQYAFYMLVPITLMGGIATKDKRLMAVAVLYSVVSFVNVAYIASVLGYDEVGYRMIENKAVLSVFGALSVITAFIHFFSVYDIIVSRQSAQVIPMTTTYPQRIAGIARLVGANFQLAIGKVKGLFKKG